MVPLLEVLTPRLVEKRGSGRYGKRGVGRLDGEVLDEAKLSMILLMMTKNCS